VRAARRGGAHWWRGAAVKGHKVAAEGEIESAAKGGRGGVARLAGGGARAHHRGRELEGRCGSLFAPRPTEGSPGRSLRLHLRHGRQRDLQARRQMRAGAEAPRTGATQRELGSGMGRRGIEGDGWRGAERRETSSTGMM
jgi:hypothetical protein